jgi:hypothetical protein
MATEGLKIVIGADISAVTEGMKVASSNVAQFGDVTEKAFDEVASNVSKAAKSFDVLSASEAALKRVSDAIDKMATEAIGAGNAIETIGDNGGKARFPLADIERFRNSVRTLKLDLQKGVFPQNIEVGFSKISQGAAQAEVSLNRLRPGANQAAAALTNVGRVAQDLPFGFVGIQNNLNPLLESFQRLKAETGSGKAALAALGQSLIGPAGIGIALSVVSSAILIFQNGIAGFNSKTKEAKDKTEEFLKTLKSVAQVADEATGSQAGDIAQVQALANVITNTNNAYSQRKRALEELQQVNKNYFGDLKLEENQMGILTARVNEYTQALVAQAVLKGFTDEISRVSVELAKQDRILRSNADEVNRLRVALENTKKSETSLTGEDRISEKYVKTKNALDDANDAFSSQFSVVGKLRTNLDDLTKSVDGAVKETLKFRDLNAPEKQKATNDGLAKQLSLLEKIRDSAKEFQGKLFDIRDIDEATNKLAGLEQQVGNLKLQIALKDAQKAKLPASEIEKLKDAIKQDTEKRINEAFEKEALLLEFNAKLKPKSIQALDVFDIAGRVFTFKEKLTVAFDGSSIEVQNIPVDITDLQGKIAKATGLDKKIPVVTLHEVRVKILGAKLTEQIELKENLLNQLNNAIKNTFENVQIDGLSSIGEQIGQAIAGGSGAKGIFNSLFDILATGLQQFGKALLAYGIALAGFKVAIKSLNPAVAIAAGVAAIAAGAAVKASLPKFAEGGIVSGPVIGQVGERFRPEVILPLDRLPQLFKQFGGDVGGGTQLIPIINNEGLYLAMKRGERSAGRKY